jgi:hypothetical protein
MFLMYAGQDPVRELNNFLQGHPRGNLIFYLSWLVRQTGLSNQVTHDAGAMCEYHTTD